MTFINDYEKPDLVDALAHFGKKGMHWGVRTGDYPGASKATNKAARKDAEEHVRAKMFYGEGAGTRRKLIKAQVEAKSKKDPSYKAAFEHHVANQDTGKHADKARKERKRKDVAKGAGKTTRGIKNMLVGNPQNASTTAAILVTAGLAAHKSGVDKVVADTAKRKVSDVKSSSRARKDKKVVDDMFKNANW